MACSASQARLLHASLTMHAHEEHLISVETRWCEKRLHFQAAQHIGTSKYSDKIWFTNSYCCKELATLIVCTRDKQLSEETNTASTIVRRILYENYGRTGIARCDLRKKGTPSIYNNLRPSALQADSLTPIHQ